MDIKFSIIVPIYGVENYLEKCLSSILNQTYSNYEVIMVNDGSKDHSDKIMESFSKKDKRFLSFYKENGGLSDARNYGVKKASGDYLLFIDGDDYVASSYLETIFSSLEEGLDVLKFHFQYVKENEIIDSKKALSFSCSGEDALNLLISSQSDFEMAWLYVYKKDFWIKNKFQYSKGTSHEDFGCTPYVLSKAKKVKAIKNPLYYYVEREGSIIHGMEKLQKRSADMLTHYDFLKEHVSLKEDKVFKSYLANAMYSWYQNLPKNMQPKFKEELIKRNISEDFLNDTISHKIKKLWIKMQLKG